MREIGLEIVAQAGRDSRYNRLVKVHCKRCDKDAIMRETNAKRNKSCGCLKRDNWHRMCEDRKPKKPCSPMPESVWTQYDHTSLSPAQTCALVAAKGLYVPSWKPSREAVSCNNVSPGTFLTPP